MATKKTVEDRTGQAAKILERSVCLTLTRNWLGNNRKVDVDDLVEKSGGKLEVDAKMLNATKALVDAKELTPVRSVQNQAAAFLRTHGIPAHSVFGNGTYLIPLALVERVNDRLNELHEELKEAATALAGRYKKAIERQREALGPLFNSADYRTPEEVVEAYDFDWTFVSFAAPEKLETVSHALAEIAHKKHEARLATAFDEVVMGLRASALDIVSNLAERLTPDEDGRPRVLRSTALDELRAFAELLPQRNLGDDAKLAQAIKKLVDRAKGIDVQQIRDSDATRAAVWSAAEEAKKVLEGLVKAGPRRGIKLPGAAA
jgi:uncharacterized protein DUF3150